MNPRMPSNKRNVCRYFATSGTCFYGDACAFQHFPDPQHHHHHPPSMPPPAPGPGGAAPPGHLSAAATHTPPALRSQSAGTPGLTNTIARGAVGRNGGVVPSAGADLHKRPEQPPFQPRAAPQRPTSYRSSLPHHASNPPKHRMGLAGVSRATSAGGAVSSSSHTHHSKPLPLSSLQGAARGRGGKDKEGGRGITALQPPPASSKQVKGRTTPTPVATQSSGGTTYFYSGRQPSYPSDFTAYTKPPAHVSAQQQQRPMSRPPGYFVSEELRQEVYQQQMACLTVPAPEQAMPKEVDIYHSLCPLECVDNTTPDQESTKSFGHSSTCYRAISQKDGLYYCLRRIHGFRLTSAKAIQELEKWRQLDHVNTVTLIQMFTTKAFGDHSVVFVYDYHPAAKTLKESHLKHQKRTSCLPEDLVWDYVVQLASALRVIHGHHLALRCLGPSKVLLTNSQRLRINCAGIVDIMTFDASTPTLSPSLHQQGDLFSLGQLLLGVALQSTEAVRPEQLHRSLERAANAYSPEFNHLLQYLLHSGAESSPHSILEVMSMCGAHIHSSVERALHREDLLRNQLSKEIQNGRLFRILAKLGVVNERPEFAGDEQWSETGDRYLLKLLRDHLFHQVLPSGTPWVNLAHVVQTLNKVDAGALESVALHSRDEKSVLVVSFSDLKACLEKTFTEVLSSSGKPHPTTTTTTASYAEGRGKNGKLSNGHAHHRGVFKYGSS